MDGTLAVLRHCSTCWFSFLRVVGEGSGGGRLARR